MIDEQIEETKKRLMSITDAQVCHVAELYHPGNNRCTVISKDGKGKFKVDVDSSSSLEYSLEITLDFANFGNGSIHGYEYQRGVSEINIVEVYGYLKNKGFIA